MQAELLCPTCGETTLVETEAFQPGKRKVVCAACHATHEVMMAFFTPSLVPDQQGFRDHLQRLIKEQGVTQTQLAVLLGVTHAYISFLLSGERSITVNMGRKLLEALGSRDYYRLSQAAKDE